MASNLTCRLTKGQILYRIAVFGVTLHIGDSNDVTRFIVSADLEKVFLPLFSGELVVIKLQTCASDSQKKPLCTKFQVTFVGLV